VPEPLIELAERMFIGPVWPASILVCLLVVYTLMALVGLIDFGFDVPDVDLDPGLDLDVPDLDVGLDLPDGAHVDLDFLHGLGATSVRLTNFSRIPVVLWGGIFAVVFWSLSYGLWLRFPWLRQPLSFA